MRASILVTGAAGNQPTNMEVVQTVCRLLDARKLRQEWGGSLK